jgi:1-acyl-sn-glycerol-3-phosphate acyltransferase
LQWHFGLLSAKLPVMLRFLPAPLRGVFSFSLLVLSTAVHCTPIIILALLKLLIPLRSWRLFCSSLLNSIAISWAETNGIWIKLTQQKAWTVEINAELRRDKWYLVTCNHQSWADIFISQRLLNKRIPQMKFFLKQQLIWVPVIGLAWWALDFPFMQRYTKRYLKRHPEKRGKDFETTRKACEKFRHMPVAIFNFMEGTRFTPAKHAQQASPYRHLLRPRPGALGHVLSAMGEQLPELVDITISYPDGVPGFWDFLCGEKSATNILITTRPIPQQLRGGDYGSDKAFRSEVQRWVNEVWTDKDEVLERAKGSYS